MAAVRLAGIQIFRIVARNPQLRLELNEIEIYFQSRFMKPFAVVLVLTLPAVLSSTASADRRLFTYTYEYKTVPQGHTALELWHTQARDTWDSSHVQTMEHVLEVEHGLTDHWDAAMYWVFEQTSSDVMGVASTPFAFHELKLETRYRFADRGEWPVDVLAYGEVVKVFGEQVWEVEGKAILARDFDKFTAALNIIGALEFEPEAEPEFGYAAGLSYEVHPKFSVGAETYAKITEYEQSFAGGPALAVAPAANLWLTFTLGFGFNDEAPALAGRFILGVEL